MGDIGGLVDYSLPIISCLSRQSLGPRNLILLTTGVVAWPTANLAIFIPFRIAAPTKIVELFWQNGATVSGNTDIGIYDSQGNRLVSAGSTVQAGTSALQTVSITALTIERGLYYMALVADNTTGTYRSVPTNAAFLRSFGVYTQVTSFPLPSTVTFAGTTTAYFPFIAISQSAIL